MSTRRGGRPRVEPLQPEWVQVDPHTLTGVQAGDPFHDGTLAAIEHRPDGTVWVKVAR